jgi:hypothetical protein
MIAAMTGDHPDGRSQLPSTAPSNAVEIKLATGRDRRESVRGCQNVAVQRRPANRLQRQGADNEPGAVWHCPGREAIETMGGRAPWRGNDEPDVYPSGDAAAW